MADRPNNFIDHPADEPPGRETASTRSERLESWKEIAAYLKRGLRTVQRWEKQEGLPVHRLQHDKASTVYALKTELDTWWDERGARLPVQDGDEKELGPGPEFSQSSTTFELGKGGLSSAALQSSQRAPLPSRRRQLWLLAAGVSALAVAAVSVYLSTARPSPVLGFHSRDTVLITNFDNRTGDPLFDGTIEAALGRELTNSPFVTVAPRVRINDMLALMRKPARTHVDAALGREICLRDGGIQSMITGRIDKLGPAYVLGAQLVDPNDGRSVASFEEEARNQAVILPAIHKLSDSIREALGEDLSQIRQSDMALQKVTTPSLRALQLYTQAEQEIAQGDNSTAFEMLRQAIAEDPNFASAYIMAAYSLGNQDKPPGEYIPYAKMALQLSGQATPAERYFIEGSYYQMSNQPDHAVAAYQALLRVDPSHYWGANNLFILYEAQGRSKELTNLAIRLANFRPASLTVNVLAGYCLSVLVENPVQAQTYIDRAKAVWTASSRQASRWSAPWLQLYPAYQSWMKDDIEGASTALNRALQNPIAPTGLDSSRDYGFFRLALGQMRKARSWFQDFAGDDAMDRDATFAVLAFVSKDPAQLSSSLRRMARLSEAGIIPVSLMIREGLLPEAAVFIRRYSGSRPPAEADPQLKLLTGELLIARGETEKGMPLLREGMQGTRNSAIPAYFLGAESLAQAYERRGDLSNALQVLQDASANRARVDSLLAMAGAPFWMRDQMDLAKLYRHLGRVQDAQRIEAELRRLLTYADPDFPMLVELKKLQDTPSIVHNQN